MARIASSPHLVRRTLGFAVYIHQLLLKALYEPNHPRRDMVDKFLRDEVSDSQGCWSKTVRQLRSSIENASKPTEEVIALGRLGDQLRLNDDTRPMALDVLRQALELAHELGNKKAIAANHIRLATTLQYLNRHQEALSQFEQAIEFIQNQDEQSLLDFAFQHLGKCLAEVGEFEEARPYFLRALTIRKMRRDTDLIRSTEDALSELASRLQNPRPHTNSV